MNQKILIIDDDLHDRSALERRLIEEGLGEILVAETGEEGLRKAQAEKPRLIILDTVLPDTNGFEICKELRKMLESSTKIIVTTGYVDAVDAGLALNLGADDHAVKTRDLSHLIETIKRHL